MFTFLGQPAQHRHQGIICQIADIVWGEGPVGARNNRPETGVLLPGSVTYKKYIQEIFLIDDTWEHES